MPQVPGFASAFLTTRGFLEKNGWSTLGAPRPVPSPTSQPLLGRMETLRLEYGTAGSRASASPTCEGLWGTGVFWNVQSWPLWVCGKEGRPKFTWEEASSAKLTRSRQPVSGHPDWPGPQGPSQPGRAHSPSQRGNGSHRNWRLELSLPHCLLPAFRDLPGGEAALLPWDNSQRQGRRMESRWARESCPPPRGLGPGTEGLRLEPVGFWFRKQQRAHTCNIRHPCTRHMYTTHHTCTPPTHTHTQGTFALASDGISRAGLGWDSLGGSKEQGCQLTWKLRERQVLCPESSSPTGGQPHGFPVGPNLKSPSKPFQEHPT